MDISQLAAPNSPSSAPRNAKSNAGDGNGFGQMLRQAGHAAAKLPAGLTQGAGASRAALDENTPREDGEPALEGLLAGLAHGEPQPLVEAAAAGLAPLAALVNQSGQPNASPGDALDLGSIRQRMDLIASAQRGVTAAGAGSTQASAGETKPAAFEFALRQSDNAGLRHQQLTTLAMQNTAQQGTLLANGSQPTTFSDAIATLAGDEALLPARGGFENAGGPSLSTAHLGGAALNTAGQPQVMGTPAQQTLSAPLASAQWQQDLGQHLVSLHQRGAQKVDLHLHPAELGPLTITLKLDDQLAQAQFFSANPQVRAAVEQAIPQLREALEEGGIQLGEAMVGEHQQRDDGNAHSRDEAALASGHGTASDAEQGGDILATGLAGPGGVGLDGRSVDLYA